jgi:hypothetical protein
LTAIAALVHDGKVYMGGDSAGVSGLSLTQRLDAKVFVNGPFIMGFTTSFRMGQLLHWAFVPPVQPNGVSDERFMSTDFIDAVRKTLKEGGYAKRENEVEQGGMFLVGYHGQLWQIDSDYQVAIPLAGFEAIGSGFDLCLGSLHTSASNLVSVPPESRVEIALEAAERFNAGVRSPFVVLREP